MRAVKVVTGTNSPVTGKGRGRGRVRAQGSGRDRLASGRCVLGTIREVYLRCGKQNCRCMTGESEERHGPYLFWDRKVNGKLSSQSIAKEDRRSFERWIANRRAMEEIVAKILALGAERAAKQRR